MIKSKMRNVDLKLNSSVIHASAVIDSTATIGEGVVIGPGCVIGPNVTIADECHLGPHVVISSNTRMGRHNVIHAFACLGGDPQDLGYDGSDTWLEMGEHNTIREYVTISRGSSGGLAVTKVGDHNCMLAYSHIAHDCVVGNHTLFVNHATIAGHVTIFDRVTLGAFTAVHQFCRIGDNSFLARATQVPRDIPPYMMVTGSPGCPCGLNLVGLKRQGFSNEKIRHLKEVYKLLYHRGISLDDALAQIAERAETVPEVLNLLNFIKGSQRGIERRTYAER